MKRSREGEVAIAPAPGSREGSSSSGQTSQERERGRVRVFRACDRCKKKKSKCDGLHPCGPCSKQDSQCSYTPTAYSTYIASEVSTHKEPVSNDQIQYDMNPSKFAYFYGARNGGSENPNTDVAVTFNELVEKNKQLERTIAQLRAEKLANASWSKGSVEPNNIPERPDRDSVVDAGAWSNDMNNGRLHSRDGSYRVNHENANAGANANILHDVGDLAQYDGEEHQDVEYLSISKFRYSRRYFRALDNVFAKSLYSNLPNNSQRLVQLPRVQSYGWNLSGKHYVTQKPTVYEEVMKDHAMIKDLLEYYFAKINPLFVMVHEPVFTKQYEIYLVTQEKSQDLYLFTGILHAICAIAMRYKEIGDNGVYPPGLEERVFEYAYEALNHFTFQYESAEIVQGWLLITLYLRTCHRQSSAWMALGHAIRLTNAMGLMKDCWTSKTINKYCKLKITRLFWCVFTWDRLLCVDTGRPFQISFSEITVPVVQQYADDGWLSKPAYSLIKLALCLNPLAHDIGYGLSAGQLEALNASLDEWNHRCMSFLGHTDETDYNKALGGSCDPAIICQIRCQFHDCIIYANTRTLFSMVNYKWEDSTSVYRKLVFNSAKDAIRAIGHLRDCGRLKTAWWLKLSSLHEATLTLLIMLSSSGSDHRQIGKYISMGIQLVDVFAADDRFAMAREVQWALRSLNHLVYLRLRDCQNLLKQAGIEHGDQDVNQKRFSSMSKLLQSYSSGDNKPSQALSATRTTYQRELQPDGPHTPEAAGAAASYMSGPGPGSGTGSGSGPASNSDDTVLERWDFESRPYNQTSLPSGTPAGHMDSSSNSNSNAPQGAVLDEPLNPLSSLGSLEWFDGFSWNEEASATSVFETAQ